METCAHPDESNNILIDPQDQTTFKVENITVTRPPLIKIYYWESLDIETLNKKLTSHNNCIEHQLKLPSTQVNSNPLKVVFWLRNLTNVEYTISLRRLRNCDCMPKETRVGFNQFRNLYHCPHRGLINISPDAIVMRPNELLDMTLESHYYILGTYKLSYELKISDSRVIVLHFHLNITTFDAVKSVLNTDMIPLNIEEHRFMSQPLWIQNVTNQNISFLFRSRNRELFRLINPNILIPPQSVWPLIVKYRPSDFENSLELFLKYGERNKRKCNPENRFQIPITCKGFLEEEIAKYTVPLMDYECSDYLYTIFPNRLEFITEIDETKTLMVAVHNYDEKCMEFKWQTYSLNEYFIFTFVPPKFTLKPKHSKLCIVQVKSFKNPLHFKRIPAVLEISSIQDNSTQIAQQLLTEIESIDDPKWAESTYVGHILLHLDIKVKFPPLQRINVEKQADESDALSNISKNYTTIFENMFWEYLSKSNHMRNTSKIPKNLTYTQVLRQETKSEKKNAIIPLDKQEAFNILSFLTAEACRELAKNNRFIPSETLDSI